MLAQVALPIPVRRTFAYNLTQEVAAGTRVRVPFRGRTLIGWVVGPTGTRPARGRIRDVDSILETEPSLAPELFQLCRWIADYYVAPLGLVLRAALPAALSHPTRPRPAPKTRRVLRLVRRLDSLIQREELFRRAHRQRECYEVVEAAGGAMEVEHLSRRLGFSASVLRALVNKGIADFVDEPILRDPFAAAPVERGPALDPTPAQRAAIDGILSAATSTSDAQPALPFLLAGVTGSGKTLVYIEVLREVVERNGRGAIVLVPEIALTPQTVSRFRAAFDDDIAVLHSALSDGERFDAWRTLRTGDRRIAIGARSAVFAPVARLGAIIVDEEHEATYKQSEIPRYHAREVAMMRARLAGGICVLASATPALESFANARAGKYTQINLPERIAGRPLPSVSVIDMRTAERAPGRFALSLPLEQAVRSRVDAGEQTILLLNRRGYAAFVQCRACGHVWHCQQCNVSLTFHRARRRLVCHYCFHEEPPPLTCSECASSDLSFRGLGTEQVEREVADTFVDARIARMDVDTTAAKWAHHDILGRFEKGEIDILLGTQMIAKGLDFPAVTLVGVVNADVAMNLPDFRASERTFQLLTQVAGRAGRGDRAGEVLIQTALPNHYAIQAALTHDYGTFAERELEERRAPGYPPFTRLANVVLSGTEEAAVQEAAESAADWIRETVRARVAGLVDITGPAPCPIDKIRGRWRWHFFMRARRATPLTEMCRALQDDYVPQKKADLRLIIDRDPVSLL